MRPGAIAEISSPTTIPAAQVQVPINAMRTERYRIIMHPWQLSHGPMCERVNSKAHNATWTPASTSGRQKTRATSPLELRAGAALPQL